MRPFRPAASAALLALSFALVACNSIPDAASTPTAAAPAPHHDPTTAEPAPASVLLVSVDGLRADYLELGITPNIARIAADGVRAEWMNPSYPTLTFPNHYTIVTGLRPDRHGIVHNSMRDPALGQFRLSRREAVMDGRWWGGEPIWVGAENAGLATATMFWPGSEAPVAGVRPTRWTEFNPDLPILDRVDTVLDWLTEPAATRPRLATLYFEHLDSAAHDHGPDSPQAHATLAEVDDAIGKLLDGLDRRGVADTVNLVLVSDHGMAEVTAGRVVTTESMVDPGDAELVTAGQSIGFVPRPGREAAAEAQLLGEHDHYACWRKAEMPPQWHYGAHPRVPAIVCQMDEGWDALPAEWAAKRGDGARGSHGFDPALPSMRAVFLASGPAFRRGVTVPAIDNVDVYPLLARLVGITPAGNDGDPDALQGALEPATSTIESGRQ